MIPLEFNEKETNMSMSPEAQPQPSEIIDHVPGMEPYTGQMPSREVITLDNATPLQRANALGSPDRVGPGVLGGPEIAPVHDGRVENVGGIVTASAIEVVATTYEQTPTEVARMQDRLSGLEDDGPVDVEAAAIRPAPRNGDSVSQWVDRQISLNRAAPYGKTLSSQQLPPEK